MIATAAFGNNSSCYPSLAFKLLHYSSSRDSKPMILVASLPFGGPCLFSTSSTVVVGRLAPLLLASLLERMNNDPFLDCRNSSIGWAR